MSEPVEERREGGNPSHQLDTEVIWSGVGTNAEIEARGIQNVLQAAGIDAIVNGFTQIPSLPFEVLVAHDQVEQSRAILAEAQANGPAAAEEAERQGEEPL